MPEEVKYALTQADLRLWLDNTAKSKEAKAALDPLKEKILTGNNRHNVEPGDLVLMVTMDPGSSVAYKKALDALVEKHAELKAEVETLVKKNTKPAPKPHIQVEARKA